MQDRTSAPHGGRERALRMLALQIAAQLPEDQEEANLVLQLAAGVLNDFLHDKQSDKKRALRCVT